MNDVTNDTRGPAPSAQRRKIAITIVCAVVAVVGALLAAQLVGSAQWRNVVPATSSVTPVFFNGTSLVRMREGKAERVQPDASARQELPLEGKARIFAAGPFNTVAFESDSAPFRFQSLIADGALAVQAPLPVVKHVVAGHQAADNSEPFLMVSTSGVANVWFARATGLERGPQLVKSLMNMKVARFSERSEHLYVAYLDGGIDRYELSGGTPTAALHARGVVKAMAVKGSVAVADDKGVRWFDAATGKLSASFPLPNIVVMEFGHYLTRAGQPAHALLAITSDGAESVLHALVEQPAAGQPAHELRTFKLPLPSDQKPVALTSTAREILVATNKGGVWQLPLH